MAHATAEVTARLIDGKSYDDLTRGMVKNAVAADVPFVPVGSYSAVGVTGVAYVIENDTSITKDMVCKGPASQTVFCQ